MRGDDVQSTLAEEEGQGLAGGGGPVILLGCAGGVVVATVKEMVTSSFTADKWLSCILPIFDATILTPTKQLSTLTRAEMSATKVSLINCEQMVQDAMRVAIKYAQAHVKRQHTEERSSNIQKN